MASSTNILCPFFTLSPTATRILNTFPGSVLFTGSPLPPVVLAGESSGGGMCATLAGFTLFISALPSASATSTSNFLPFTVTLYFSFIGVFARGVGALVSHAFADFFRIFTLPSPFKNAMPFSLHAAAIKIFSSLGSIPSFLSSSRVNLSDLLSSLSAISMACSLVGFKLNCSLASLTTLLSGSTGVLPK